MILLQQIQDIDKLTKVSLELAEAASNYGALKIIFGVFMVMMLLIVLVFVSQSVFLIKRVQGISDVSDKLIIISKDYQNPILVRKKLIR